MAASLDNSNAIDTHVTTALSVKNHRLKWTLKDFSKLPDETEFTSPEIKISPNCEWYFIFLKKSSDLYLYLVNQSEKEVKFDYEISFFDLNDKQWYHDGQAGIVFGTKERKDILKSTKKILNDLYSLSNDTLILICDLKINRVITTGISEIQGNDGTLQKYVDRQKLSADLKTLFDSRQHADITLNVDGCRMLCHKAILCARSPVFERMFQHEMDEQAQNTVQIDDVKFPALKKLVDFMYCGMVDAEESIEMTYELYYAADKYEMLGFRKMCADTLLLKLTVDNATRIFVWADRHRDDRLKIKVKDFIVWNFETISNTDTWDEFVSSETKLASEIIKYYTKKQTNTTAV